jgi:hypothetical protein
VTHDRHSYAEPALVRTTHLELELDLDFAAKVLTGTATHTLAWSGSANRLVLDTRDLTVLAVEGSTADGWEPLEFSLAVPDVPDKEGATLNVPRALLGDVMYVADEVATRFRTLDGRSLLCFGSSGLSEKLCLAEDSGEVVYLVELDGSPGLSVNASLDAFVECVRAVIDRFPFYDDASETDEHLAVGHHL